MRLGFSFNGIHSKRFGITMLTKSRTLLPETKQYYYSALAADGNYDFTYANSRGRAAYGNRTFQIVMQVYADNALRLSEKINSICSWLIGRGKLIFDDIPDSVWEARVVNSVDFAPEINGSKAVLNVVFEAEPFSNAQFDTMTGPEIDHNIRLESGLPITLAEEFIFTMQKSTKNCEFEIWNIGTWYVCPKLIIETEIGKENEITLECGGKVLKISCGICTEIIIDTDCCTVSDEDGNCIDRYTDGEFFELAPGKNIITLTCGKKLKTDMNISVSYTPRYLYTADFTKFSEECDA